MGILGDGHAMGVKAKKRLRWRKANSLISAVQEVHEKSNLIIIQKNGRDLEESESLGSQPCEEVSHATGRDRIP